MLLVNIAAGLFIALVALRVIGGLWQMADIAGNVPLGRFQSLQRAMTEKLAELKATEKTKHAKAG